jgi:hypothetical protein
MDVPNVVDGTADGVSLQAMHGAATIQNETNSSSS